MAAPATRIAGLSIVFTIVAPIASARTPEQLADLVPGASPRLSKDEAAKLDAASA